MMLPPAGKLDQDPKLLNPLSLAYMGDAVLEIFVRHHLIQMRGGKPHQLHQMAKGYVSAKAQAKVLLALQEHLSEEEWWFIKRGRNTKSGTVPKNTDIMEYRMSSGFECMLGYLYLTHQQERLQEIMDKVFRIIEAGEKE
ncbi:Mini-ribonuclease 3 [Ammoniphilus resinae]|uniref:Mini-ribonuclease 3 n=1 Tax=Ammoniphilus resinae TaxID=861532 RepID=A0ABS4GRP3_9BACL|nr:Mini-ribonuclease 3 [Ammoniphilus resinae]MBP1932515.1 ribonuclease-3 family protein [Ammoniphilus resinae]